MRKNLGKKPLVYPQPVLMIATYDENGNPIWKCECHIEEMDYYFDSHSTSKKEAKKIAAFDMLQYVLNEEEE